jgi:Flp pilus assembly protein TadD
MQQVLADAAAPSSADFMYLDPAFKALLEQRIEANWSAPKRLAALRSYLFAEDELDIRYGEGVAKTAMETYESRSGNCLSLTNLFVAAARSIGIDSHFQPVDIKPIWGQQGAMTIRYEHIVATGQLPNGVRYIVDFLPEAAYGDFDQKPSADEDALALFFSNKGAQRLLDGEALGAITQLQKALQLSPSSSAAWSNMGAAQRRAGNLELAEFSYLQALKHDKNNDSALNNLAALYDSQGRTKDAQQVAKRVQHYRQRNPYYHFLLANLFFDNGQYPQAVLLLREAIKLKDDEPNFYQALALTYTRQGEKKLAQQVQQRAVRLRVNDTAQVEQGFDHRFWLDTGHLN